MVILRMYAILTASILYSHPAVAECMIKALPEASINRHEAPTPADKRRAGGAVLAIFVPAEEVADYASRGFQPAQCPATLGAREEWEAEACQLAESGNEAVQKRLTEVLTVSPAQLCASARAAAGRSVSASK